MKQNNRIKTIIYATIIFVLQHTCVIGQATYFFGEEQFGSSIAARTQLDTQATQWQSYFGTSAHILNYGFSANPSANNYIIQPGSGYTLDITFRDMTGGNIGTLASSNAILSNSTSMQGGSPKPLSRLNEYFWNETAGGTNNARNAFLIELNKSFIGLGFWVGDLETRTDGNGTGAMIYLLDASNTILDTKVIESSTPDQSLCGNPTNPSGTEFNGCGNNAGRFIGIKNENQSDIRKVLVVVGDDDSNPGFDDGFTEHLSFMGGYLVSCIPTPETCNNIDDDCDGLIDEDIAPIVSSCSAGVGVCLASGTTTTSCVSGALSTTSCNAVSGSPSTEICDNLDNDCDGAIDEALSQPTSCGVGACQMTGTESCSAGIRTGNSCIAGSAGIEFCNNIDDDCDGLIDEDIAPIVSSCSGGVGACLASGTTTTSCVSGALSTTSCNAVSLSPSTEICDNLDNDCDGTIDEALSQPTACGVGACQMTGTETCSAGIRTGNSCIAGSAGIESCNNIDDDCDGLIDEGNICISTPQSQSVGGGCVVGFETCDGKDNDCDNTIDEGCFTIQVIETSSITTNQTTGATLQKTVLSTFQEDSLEKFTTTELMHSMTLPLQLPKTGASK